MNLVRRLADGLLRGAARLYVVPGMQHCGGGPGPSFFGPPGVVTASNPARNVSAALEQWVQKGVAPDSIIATKYVDPFHPSKGIEMTRPLCPYPQIAKYKGSGNPNDAANFVCALP